MQFWRRSGQPRHRSSQQLHTFVGSPTLRLLLQRPARAQTQLETRRPLPHAKSVGVAGQSTYQITTASPGPLGYQTSRATFWRKEPYALRVNGRRRTTGRGTSGRIGQHSVRRYEPASRSRRPTQAATVEQPPEKKSSPDWEEIAKIDIKRKQVAEFEGGNNREEATSQTKSEGKFRGGSVDSNEQGSDEAGESDEHEEGGESTEESELSNDSSAEGGLRAGEDVH